GEKAAPTVIAPGTTLEEHRKIEQEAARKVSDESGMLQAAFRAYGAGDYARALGFFKRAAERGDPRAAYYIGVMHSNGEGVKRDLAESAKWYQRAADQGNPDGMYALARLYVIGSGVPRDVQKALELYEQAAQAYPPGEQRDKAIEQKQALIAVLEEIENPDAAKSDDEKPKSE
ncbi:MAG TPA: tetratricopeptide repeat protein, partial [Steroidobacteraceae bacterium]